MSKIGQFGLHNPEHDFVEVKNTRRAVYEQLGYLRVLKVFHHGNPGGSTSQESFEILTFLDGLKFWHLDLAIIIIDYKTISRFDYKVSNLEFWNILEELQVRIEKKQLRNVSF